MPPAYVKPYVKRQKNDATDAEAICEAVTRANMRFVPTKTPEQQSGLVLTARAICSSALTKIFAGRWLESVLTWRDYRAFLPATNIQKPGWP
jgi:transposase